MSCQSSTYAIALTAFLSLGAWSDEPAAGAQAEDARTESQREAHALFMKMAAYIASLDRYSVTIDAGYDVVQDSGQKIEFLEGAQVTLARPNRMRVTMQRGEHAGSDIVFDGAKMTVAETNLGVFSQAPQPESLDHAIVYFIRDLRMRLPLAPMFLTGFPAELEKRAESTDYVADTDALGALTHHLAARLTTGVDLQVWVADGEQALPQRIVLTYRDQPGQPQFRARFSHWNLKPKIDAGTFAFKQSPDARQIAFAVQIQQLGEGAPGTGASHDQ